MALTHAEVKAHPLYIKLDPNHKKWVDEFCTNGGDIKAAGRTVYGEKKSDNYAYALRRHKSIKPLLDAFLDIDPDSEHFTRDELLGFYSGVIRGNKATIAEKLAATRLFSALKWPAKPTPKDPSEPEQESQWELVRKMEKEN